MKLKYFHRRILCVLLAVFFLMAGLDALTQNAHGSFKTVISNYENYLKITEQLDLPPYYVMYEHIQVLGDYQYYAGPEQLLHDGSWMLHEYYAEYCITDKNDQSVSLYMKQKNLMAPKEDYLPTPLFTADMRTLNTEKSGTVIRGPLRYRYESGRLARIGWRLGDVDFYLSIPQDYPMDAEETVCSRLLSRNYFVALAAYYELIGDMPLQPGETRLSRMQHIIWPPMALILLITACIGAVCIFRHIRRKKRIVVDHSSLQVEITETD